MSLPGLSLLSGNAASIPTTSSSDEPILHDLAPNSEWRFEVPLNTTIEVKVLTGTAELFGTELAINHAYHFSGTKGAIFTYRGCQLSVQGSCEEYTAEETPMTEYANLHFALENIRASAPAGPKVLVVGPNNSGKTSLVKILTAYAVRQGRVPVVVNTDPTEGMLSVPGSLSAAAFGSLMDVEEGWGSSPTSGPSVTPVKLPLVYWFGLGSPEDDTKLFKAVCSRLALAVQGRLDEDEECKRGGVVIDTCGSVSGGKDGYAVIGSIVAEFNVDIIITLGSERLHSDLSRRYSYLKVLKLSKSGGVADRDASFMASLRQRQIREYFFGNAFRTLSPHTQTVDFSALTIFRIHDSTADALERSFLPGGAEDEEGDVKKKEGVLEKVGVSSKMMHCVMAVVYASPGDRWETVRDATVMGFVYIADVDEKKQRVRVLAPVSGRLGDRPFVWGRFPEAAVNLI